MPPMIELGGWFSVPAPVPAPVVASASTSLNGSSSSGNNNGNSSSSCGSPTPDSAMGATADDDLHDFDDGGFLSQSLGDAKVGGRW